jgi:hypothetical protein
MKRRTEITIETRHVLLVSNRKLTATGWCEQCGSRVRLMTAEMAAQRAGVSTRTSYRRAEAGQLHFTETQAGLLLVCANSLD